MKNLSERVTFARNRIGDKLNQSNVGKTVGVSREAIAQWENGSTKTIRSSNLFNAAKVLEVSPKWLATGLGPVGNETYIKILSELERFDESEYEGVLLKLRAIKSIKTYSQPKKSLAK